MVNIKTWRTLGLFSRRSLIVSVLAMSAACFQMDKSSSPSSPPPASPVNDNRDTGIVYDRPGNNTKLPEVPSAGGATPYRVSSRLMTNDLQYRVILPVEYNSKPEVRYAVIYLLHGLTGHFSDWTDRTDLVQTASKYKFIIVTPEGNDGWYTDSSTTPNSKYESYIINELIPEVDRRFRTLPDRQHRVIAGLSMGGYGALKFGLKYPDRFAIVGSFSGALQVAQWSESTGGNKLIGKSIDTVFGPPNSPTRKANDIFRIVGELTPGKAAGLPYIYMSCGTEDGLIEGSRAFDKLLTEKGVVHEYKTSRGGHDWTFWGEQMHVFLELCNSRLGK